MTTPLVDEDESIALRLVGIIVVLILGLAIGLGIYKSRPAKASVAAAPVVAVLGEETATIVVENGVVKFFFATASAELATGANEALGELIKAVSTGKLVVISGYHDATGDAALNEELAKKRALAVRDALLALGVAEAGIELKKPELTTGSGSLREARRVEVLVR
jgi:outer membrane protein OmpA-like peptidoglycan-associated protein